MQIAEESLHTRIPTSPSPSRVEGSGVEGRGEHSPLLTNADRWLTGSGVADQLRTAAVTVGVHAQQWADVRGVELQLLDLRLRRHQVTRHQDAFVEVAEGHLNPFLTDGDDRCLVLGFALVVLLAVGEAWLGVGRHGDPWLRPVDAGLEGTAVVND